MFQTIITFIIVFSILVIIHEFGHFYFAKKAGILVREFAIGMGPKIFSHRKNGTTYTIRMLPIGGYVRMAGIGDEDPELKPGMPLNITLDEAQQVAQIDLSNKQHLRAVPIELLEADLEQALFIKGIIPGSSEAVTYEVKRDATIIEADGTEVQIAPIDVQYQSAPLLKRMMTNFAGPMNNFILGIAVFITIAFVQGGVTVNDNRLGDIQPDSPAEAAGLRADDEVLAIEGQEITDWTQLVASIQANPGKEITLSVVTKGQEARDVLVTPDTKTDEQGNDYGLIGVAPPMDRTLMAKIRYGFDEFWLIATSIFGLVFSMFRTGFQPDSFGGPVAIYAATEQVVDYGFLSVLSFLAYLSINLGVVNLLPVPALDGGKLLLNIVEGVRGKPLDPEKEGIITAVGMGLLLLLMVIVTWNDIQRFFFGQ
ncbi:RIP metalloprotease RseP [Trichococcus ilyis]|uniref:Zinc metalloprotease n=1 Tax=Trichococcus ilyis TaxID=640938 RepID=A0A143Y4T4_9LACT|nr:RIP metalloprotease RseP [Trichococcus ilyis]CZQ80100.1 peptidase m50 [Trichococcus ilyis]SEI57380.1 regulator of sigma E protease [Trichococcus ilyis]